MNFNGNNNGGNFNQGNGGNFGGGGNELNGLFDDFDPKIDPNSRSNNRPELGKGVYMLARYFTKTTHKAGNIVIAEMIVVQAPQGGQKQPGDKVSIAWYVSKVGMAGKYEKARGIDFVVALLGLTDRNAANAEANKLRQQHQPGTGIMLYVVGEQNGQWLNHRYEPIPGQSEAMIKTNRAKVESMYAATQQQQQAPQQPPQGQGTMMQGSQGFNPGGFVPPQGQQQAAPPMGNPFGGQQRQQQQQAPQGQQNQGFNPNSPFGGGFGGGGGFGNNGGGDSPF